MGETFTVPDIIAGHIANWVEYGAKWSLPQEGRLAEYFAAVRARPALAAALAKGKAAKAAADAAA